MTPRREFSARTKRAAWERADGFCEGMLQAEQAGRPGHGIAVRCNAPLTRDFHYDHIDPDWFSKNNELENCQVLCHLCHADKTASDQGKIAKSKRIINKRIKAKKRKRGFRGWRRFDGSVVIADDSST